MGKIIGGFFIALFLFFGISSCNLFGTYTGGDSTDRPERQSGTCEGFTDEAAFTNCMENQNTGGDFPAP